MKTKPILIGGLAVACVVAGLVFARREAAVPAATSQAEPSRAKDVAVPVAKPAKPEPVPSAVTTTSEATSQTTVVEPEPQAGLKPQAIAKAKQPSRPAKEPLKDPLAREALSLVGIDPRAELYWADAINNPNLPANERQDLIEDLNEEGLSNPKHPTLEDLPLIISRIEVIEALWPWAIDKVNDEAFQEAYKDLLNLANLATGSGEPVK